MYYGDVLVLAADTTSVSCSTPKNDTQRQATFISPVHGGDVIAAAPSTRKKKRLLNRENVSPYAGTPTQLAVAPSPSDAHHIVKRQLRSRKH